MSTAAETRIVPGDYVSNATGPGLVTDVYAGGLIAVDGNDGLMRVGLASAWYLVTPRVETLALAMLRGYSLDDACLMTGPLNHDLRRAGQAYGAYLRRALDSARELAIATGRPLGTV